MTGFDTADIQKIRKDVMQKIAVFPGRQQKFDLLFRQRSDLFFQQQVNGHADGCQRGLQLMRYGRNEPAFQLLNLAVLRHILQDQNHTCRMSFTIGHRRCIHVKIPFLAIDK